jgi:hypothetical protein
MLLLAAWLFSMMSAIFMEVVLSGGVVRSIMVTGVMSVRNGVRYLGAAAVDSRSTRKAGKTALSSSGA